MKIEVVKQLKMIFFYGAKEDLKVLLPKDKKILPTLNLASFDDMENNFKKFGHHHFKRDFLFKNCLFLKERREDQFICHTLVYHLNEKDITDLNKEFLFTPLIHIEKFEGTDGALLTESLAFFWDLFTDEKKKFPVENGFRNPHLTESDELIIFGGSFNPWHKGHEACLKLCPKKSQIIIVPDFNPFKEEKEIPCYFQYYKSISEIAKSYGATSFPLFCGIPYKNPTSSWAPRLKYPFSLLMGDDSFVSLPRWNQPEKFLNLTKNIYLVSRTEEKERIDRAKSWLHENFPYVNLVLLGNHPYQDLSSTQIRKKKRYLN